MTVTFFGHRDAPVTIKPLIESTIIDLIKKHKNLKFYVGNNGTFDSMARKTLQKFKHIYPNIEYAVVLSYINQRPNEYEDYSDTIFPDGLENTPLKFAICKRNEWMLKQSDIVITFVKHKLGGAYKYKLLSIKKGKIVIELSEQT